MLSLMLKSAHRLFVSAGLVAFSLSFASLASAQIEAQVVMDGLNNPRGLAIGADGAVYVAEAGRGGNGASVVAIPGETVSFGTTGAVSRWRLGEGQSQVRTGIASVADQAAPPQQGGPGSGATGLHDVVWSGGEMYGVIGWVGAGAERTAFAANGGDGSLFGRFVRLTSGGAFTGDVTYLADFVSYEQANNTDNGTLPGPGGLPEFNSNPYGIFARAGGGFAAIDAGANVLFDIGADNTTLTPLATFLPQPNPLYDDANPANGGPVYQAVPTSVTLGPNGSLFVSQLAGYPFKQGGADIYSVPSGGGAPTAVYTGFTTVIDLAFGPDGNLYVLQLTQNGLGPEATTGPGPGQLIRVDPVTGVKTLLDVTIPGPPGGLLFSSGMVFGGDGALYVSNLGISPGGGQVLRLTSVTVPEPGAGLLALVGIVPIAAIIARRRRK